jgi:hypothetical protein
MRAPREISNEENAQGLIERIVGCARSPGMGAESGSSDEEHGMLPRILAGVQLAGADAALDRGLVGRQRCPGTRGDGAIDGMSSSRAPQADASRLMSDAAMPAAMASPRVAGADPGRRQQNQQYNAHSLCGGASHEQPPNGMGRKVNSIPPEECQPDFAAEANPIKTRGTRCTSSRAPSPAELITPTGASTSSRLLQFRHPCGGRFRRAVRG